MTNLNGAISYLEKLPFAIAGSGGDKATRRAAMVCRRFGLSEGETWQAMTWYNDNRCQPKWSERDLRHKMSGLSSVSVQKPLGDKRETFKRNRPFVAPPKPAVKQAADTRPIYLRSEQEEELWWAQKAIELGTTLEEFDRACGNTE